jgi:hypothetical protein
MLRLSLITAAAALVAAAATAASPAATKCVHRNPDPRWKAVFGHFPTMAPANALVAQLRTKGFSQAAVENVGCGDLAVVVVGLDTQSQRDDFTAEAAAAGWPGVSYQAASNDGVPLPKGTWRAVFGTFPTLAAASALEQQAAEHGFRIIDIEYGGPRKWRVTVSGIPQRQSQTFAREARAAGFTVSYEIK